RALHLWPNQIRDRQANVPCQRLRPSWLLFLQLLAAAVLVAAALQPALPAGAALARHSLVLVDASASMQATDLTPSRLAEARREVNAVIDQLGPSDRMTIIAVGPTARIVASVTGDRDALHRAVNGIRASNGPADLSSALILAAGLVRPGDDARAYLFSDGIVQPLRASFAVTCSRSTIPPRRWPKRRGRSASCSSRRATSSSRRRSACGPICRSTWSRRPPTAPAPPMR